MRANLKSVYVTRSSIELKQWALSALSHKLEFKALSLFEYIEDKASVDKLCRSFERDAGVNILFSSAKASRLWVETVRRQGRNTKDDCYFGVGKATLAPLDELGGDKKIAGEGSMASLLERLKEERVVGLNYLHGRELTYPPAVLRRMLAEIGINHLSSWECYRSEPVTDCQVNGVNVLVRALKASIEERLQVVVTSPRRASALFELFENIGFDPSRIDFIAFGRKTQDALQGHGIQSRLSPTDIQELFHVL